MNSISGKKLLFSIITLFISVCILELSVRVLIHTKSILMEPDKHSSIIEEDGYVRLKPRFIHIDEVSGNTFSTNSLGFRGREIGERKPDKTVRIIALGGSTTFGIGSSDNSHTYPSLLETKLNRSQEVPNINFEVINAGIPGARSTNILKLFSDQVLKLNADIVLIYSGWNDWNGFYNEGPSVFEYDSILYRLNLRFSELSILYSKVRNLIFGYRSRVKRTDYEKRALKVLSQKYYEKPYKDNIVNLVKLCRGNGIKPVLILQPPSLGSFSVIDKKKYLSKDPLFQESRKIMTIVQSRLMEIQKNISLENNVAIADINYMFDVFENGDSLYYDIIHFSDNGNNVIAEGISKWILSDKSVSGVINPKKGTPKTL